MATKVVGSDQPTFASDQLKPSAAGYGQNGFGGASSDTPGKNTTSGFLPQTDLASAQDARKKSQQRTISDTSLAPAYGMSQRTPRSK